MSKSFFPIKIQIVKTGEIKVIDKPENVPQGIKFRVLENNV